MQKHQDRSVEPVQASPQIVATQVSATFSGPLPLPSQLAQYEAIQPGFAQAILTMAQKDQEHQHQIDRGHQETERFLVESQMKCFGRGQIIGGIIAVVAVIAAAIASILGAPSAGIGIVSAVMVPLGAAFAFGKWQDKKG